MILKHKIMFRFLFLLCLIGNGVVGFQGIRIPSVASVSNSISLSTTSIPASLSKCSRNSLISHHLSIGPRRFTIGRLSSESSYSYADVSPTEKASFLWKRQQITQAQRFICQICLESWWISPMILAFVPIYCALFKGTCASMPSWWPVVNMNHIRQTAHAAIVIGGFLMSNIAYFLSGTLLIRRFQPRDGVNVVHASPMSHSTRFTMLGVWILLAGAVSTIFHSVQALGSYVIAESLCYVDHGIAISACLYYFKTCGFPSKKVWALGIAGLLALIFTHPFYALFHSLWHFLSAAAATFWAIESHDRLYNTNK